VHLNQVALSFTWPSAVSPLSIPASLDIDSHGSMEWNFDTSNDIFLPFPSPASFILSLFCDGFTKPATFSFPLAAYQASSAGGSYRFPNEASFFVTGEFWYGQNGTHGAGACGSQLFGQDLGVVGFDSKSMSWSFTLPDTNGDQNSDLRIWNKPICAMADGIVLEAINDVPNNPHPLHWTSEADLQQQPNDQQLNYWGSFTHGGGGNHFYIQHGEQAVLYAHMQKGSLTQQFLTVGAQVKAGDLLSLAGNSGNSTGPHLHIHAIKGTAPESGRLRPLPFNGILAIDMAAASFPYPQSPWVTVQGQGLPNVPSLIWPGTVWGTLSDKGIYEVAIDPLALILRSDIYVLLTLPDPPPPEVIERQVSATVKTMPPAERKRALARAKKFMVFVQALQRELET
jgi:murein DD-endopeptidase MepM/ murein hydrolase activator NlpD